MKKSLLIISALTITASAFAQEPTRFECTADTWVRENNLSYKGEKTVNIEVNVCNLEDGSQGSFVGLFGFDFALPAGQKVQSAYLHLVTNRYKGGSINLYGYQAFLESTTWADEADKLDAARATDPILNFTAAGQWNKDISDKGINEDMQDLAKWTQDLDVTNYVKSLPTTSTGVYFLLADATAQNTFFSKDNTGVNAYKNDDDTFNKEYTAEELLPYLEVTFVEDSDSSTDTLFTLADTHLRGDNGSGNGSAVAMEIKRVAATDEKEEINFYGLMRFELPAEVLNTDSYEVTGASLRLVCTQNKGDRQMGLYDYSNKFDEATNFAAEETFMTAAIANEPVATFQAKGQGTKAITDKGINEDFRTVDAWTSEIDITEYIKAKAADNSSTVAFLLRKEATHNDAMKFATKEATDLNSHAEEAANYTFTFAAKDLVPQITLSYSKKSSGNEGDDDDDTSGVSELVNQDITPEFYNLQGVRIANPEQGNIYIVRRGNTASKVRF